MSVTPYPLPNSGGGGKSTKAPEAGSVRPLGAAATPPTVNHGPPESVSFSLSQREAAAPNLRLPGVAEGVPLPGLTADLVNYRLKNNVGFPKTLRIAAMRSVFGLKGPESATMQAEAIIGTDDRRRISDTSILPYQRICMLEFLSPNGTGMIGTGWFIGPRTVVTAGHCIYCRDSRYGIGPMRKPYKVYAGRNLDQVAGEASVVDMATTRQWLDNGLEAYDFGVVYIDSPLGADDQLGSFDLGIVDEGSTGMLVSVVGYPGDLQRGLYGSMWGDTNRIESVTPDRLAYLVDTMGGNSGGPVIYSDGKGTIMAVGIHNYGDTGKNFATRINQAVADQFKKWVQ